MKGSGLGALAVVLRTLFNLFEGLMLVLIFGIEQRVTGCPSLFVFVMVSGCGNGDSLGGNGNPHVCSGNPLGKGPYFRLYRDCDHEYGARLLGREIN